MSKVIVIKTEDGCQRYIWEEIPREKKVTRNDIGRFIHVARYAPSMITKLIEFHDAGEPRWKSGGVLVWNEKFGQYEAFYHECVMLHPSEFKRGKKTIKLNKKAQEKFLEDDDETLSKKKTNKSVKQRNIKRKS